MKTIFTTILLCFATLAMAQTKSLIVEEGGTGAYKAIMKEEAPFSFRKTWHLSARRTCCLCSYGATEHVPTLLGNISSS